MKTLYTILFFIDTVLLVLLSWYLFKMIDKGAGAGTFACIIAGMLLSIASLTFLLFRYLKQPLN
jgi:hypothetical protein